MRFDSINGMFVLTLATTVACSHGTVGSLDPGVEIASPEDSHVEMTDLSEALSPADDSLKADKEEQVWEDALPTDNALLVDIPQQADDAPQVDGSVSADTPSDGAQQLDQSELFEDTAAIEKIEPSDTAATDAVWLDCEVVGPYCTSDDIVIFTTYCSNVPGGVERWPVYAVCGQKCLCGNVGWAVIPPDPIWYVKCDEWDVPEVPLPATEFCATGKRVLCAQPSAPETRVGCCDAEGRVHCEWNPAPDGNRCLEG